MNDEDIVLTDEETEVEPVDTVETEVETVETEPEDDGLRERLQTTEAQLNQLANEIKQYQQAQTARPDDDLAEIQAIVDIAYSDPVTAERMRVELAEKRVARTMRDQYGAQLTASGISMAIQDAKAKYRGESPEMLPYIEATVAELGLQNEIPAHLVEPVRRLAYGAAAIDGKVPLKGKPVPKVVATTGAERGTATISTIPAAVQQDASEFEKHFGKAALGVALKEAELA